MAQTERFPFPFSSYESPAEPSSYIIGEEVGIEATEVYRPLQDTSESVSIELSDHLGSYLREIGSYRLLESKETVHFAKLLSAGREAERILESGYSLPEDEPVLCQIRNAGVNARQTLINANLRYVVSLAKKFRSKTTGSKDDFWELIQAGNHGLLRAVDKFDFHKGYEFSTYAKWWIAREMRVNLHIMRDRGVVNRSRIAQKYMRHRRKLFESLGRQPTQSEMVENTGLPAWEVTNTEAALYQDHQSLDQPVKTNDSDSVTKKDTLIDSKKSGFEIVDDKDYIKWMLEVIMDTLSEQQLDIFLGRIGIKTGKKEKFETIGKRHGGKSKQAVQQQYQRILAKAKKAVEEKENSNLKIYFNKMTGSE